MPMASLRKRARILMWLVTVPFTVLALFALAQLGFVMRNGAAAAPMLIFFAPMYIYVGAIWMVRQALKAIAQGGQFHEIVSKLLFRVGIALFFGALFNVFGVPAASIAFKARISMPFDGAAVTLGVVGATLVLLSQLLKQAASMREELDSFL